MLIRNNDADGGTDGTTTTVGNSGGPSGDAFSAIAVSGAGSAVTFSSTVTRDGPLAYKFAEVSGYANTQWTFGSQGATLYARAYVYFSGSVFSTFVVSDAGAWHSVQFNGTHWTVRAVTGSTVAGTTAPVANTWYRVEAQFVYGASGGSTVARIYSDAGTLLETITGTGGTNASTAVVYWCGATGQGPYTGTLYMDNLALSDQGWIGAYVPPVNTGAMFL